MTNHQRDLKSSLRREKKKPHRNLKVMLSRPNQVLESEKPKASGQPEKEKEVKEEKKTKEEE
jgi:hypothetical protein